LTILIEALVEQLRVSLQAIARFDAEISTVSKTLPDYPLFSALPGAGAALAPRLLVAFGEQRQRYESAAEFQKYTVIAPVTESSGKKHWVHWRVRCSTFLRQTFVEWAAETITRSFWAGAYYRQQRAKGCSRQAALRALAYKWIRILSIAVGKHERRTMSPRTSTRSSVAVRRYSLQSWGLQKILDRQPQGVTLP